MQQRSTQRSKSLTRALAASAGIWALALSGAARAQDAATDPRQQSQPVERQIAQRPRGFLFSPRFRPNDPPPAPGGPGGVLEPVLPPGVTQTFPLAPFQQPDILRNYLQMRATSPRPNEFMGGQFNPQYRSSGYPAPIYDPPYYGPYDPYYPSGAYGYGGSSGFGFGGYARFGNFSFGGYVAGPANGIPVMPSVYSMYGRWYPQSIPQNRVIIQREIIYVRPESRASPPPAAAPAPASGDYYLTRPSTETLNDAVGEIQKAWLNGDFTRFQSRVRSDGKVRIYLKGRYQYSVDRKDFGQMTRDAMDRIDTTGFDLDRVENLGGGRAFASGKHTYLDPDKTKREVYVSYGLTREDGRWKIAEAGSSTTPIKQHEE